MNLLKEKIQEGKCICGTHIQLADPAVAMIYGQLGYDYIWIDTEHSALGYQDVQNALNAANLAGTPVVVRVPQDDLTFTKKVLEMGPDGIIFPMVHTAEEANRLIGYTLYPPYGNRGCGPMRAYNYSMSMTYNRIPRPAMVAVSGGEDRVIIRRETYEDLCRNEL